MMKVQYKMGHDVSNVKDSVSEVAKNNVAIVKEAKLVKDTFVKVVKMSVDIASHDGCRGQIGGRHAQGSL